MTKKASKKLKDLQALPPIETLPGAADKPVTQDLPGIEGKGVARIKIPEVEKCIAKYELKKNARCAVSPDELAAKKELAAALHAHADELPVNAEGQRFYRFEDVDYILEEKLKRRAADDGSDED
jgi:hypothetical protein